MKQQRDSHLCKSVKKKLLKPLLLSSVLGTLPAILVAIIKQYLQLDDQESSQPLVSLGEVNIDPGNDTDINIGEINIDSSNDTQVNIGNVTTTQSDDDVTITSNDNDVNSSDDDVIFNDNDVNSSNYDVNSSDDVVVISSSDDDIFFRINSPYQIDLNSNFSINSNPQIRIEPESRIFPESPTNLQLETINFETELFNSSTTSENFTVIENDVFFPQFQIENSILIPDLPLCNINHSSECGVDRLEIFLDFINFQSDTITFIIYEFPVIPEKVPEPTATFSLLAFFTFGVALALKRKH